MNANKFLLLIQGILLVVLGFITISHPVGSILVLSVFFAWFLIIAGGFGLINAIISKDNNHRVLYIIDGIIMIILGVLFLFNAPIFPAVILVYLTIMWFIVSSVSQIALVSKTGSGVMKFLVIALAVIAIIICIYSLFDPLLATGIFIFTLSFNFFLLGFSRIAMMFTNTPEESNF